jgi:integrase
MAGIDRIVMTLNPLTRQAEQRPLYEVAASHLARRTFIGNLYKQVKDPALIASLTGHTENSVSFTRYRAIDDDTKRDILKMIE